MNENNTQNVIPNVDSKSKQERNVPDLRFPIFQNFPLKKTNFGNIATYKKGPFGSSLKKEIFVPKGIDTIKVYEQQNAIEHDHTLERYFISYDYYLKMKSFTVKAGDIIVSCAGTIGEVYTLPSNAETGVINQALMKINPNYSIVDHNYFIYSFEKMISSFSDKYSNGSVIKNIPPFSDLKKYPINLPILSEQKFIANFIEILNMRIDTQKKIINSLKSLIISIKNNEFYDVVGTKYKLEDVLIEINNKTTENNQYEVLSSTVKGIYKQSEYFDRAVASENNVGYKIVKKDNIVISPQNLWMGNISYNDKFETGIVSPSYKIFNVNNNFNGKYIFEMLTTKKSLYLYKTVSEQGASIVRRNLNFEAFMQLTFNIPNTNHQNDFIEKLNLFQNKLSLENKILSLYEQQKQYLLDKLFI